MKDCIFTFKQIEDKILGHLTKKGNRALAFKLWCDTLDIIRNEIDDYDVSPLMVVEKAVLNARPLAIVKKRNRAGTYYQIPYIVQNTINRDGIVRDDSSLIALRWIIKTAASDKTYNVFSESLAMIFLDAYNNIGPIIKKKNDMYLLAFKNRMYVHYLFASKKRKKLRL